MVDTRLAGLVRSSSPRELSEGCRYVLGAGGKRIRSTLVILACESVGGRAAHARDAGAAVEIMHNFSLVHDDVMDNAPSRRGRPTVHIRWDLNNALLVGDILLGYAYELLLRTKTPHLDRLARLFTGALLTVCKGQALDLEFERRTDITVADYYRMIEMKTGRLISVSAEMGAIIGRGTAAQVRSLRSFGHYLGRAFQLQDDLLDVTGEQRRLGKAIGGDILERKKTYLLLTAAERARGADRTVIQSLLHPRPRARAGQQSVPSAASEALIATVNDIYHRYRVIEDARALVRRNTERALHAIDALPSSRASAMLRWLAEHLVQRVS